MDSFLKWVHEKSTGDWYIYGKRLSGNDTGLTGGKQVGIYIHKPVAIIAFPSIDTKLVKNPRYAVRAKISSHSFPEQGLHVIYYNDKFFGGSRNESRITKWNTDFKGSPVQDPENTGALILFAFHMPSEKQDADFVDVWLCNGLDEERFLEDLMGEIVPGGWMAERGDRLFSDFSAGFAVAPSAVAIPESWTDSFPSGEEIISHLLKSFKWNGDTPDALIVERRKKEYSLFRQVEELHTLHHVKKGFRSVDEFMQMANSVSNRRKSRSGRSLEIHLVHLFRQFGLLDFSNQCQTEVKKRPDFIFPSCTAYHDENFPSSNLRMLAVKTTCKDRWRQVLNEASRVSRIHLFTLQEGVSVNQFSEMVSEGVSLVVPKTLHTKYPEALRCHLLTLGDFINEMRALKK
ncbi:type II restriction endonuclease [Pseudomonas syringae group sp. J254-4]|uniref:type II restriction endonuclease n=1 Tax=Pseudomonas syringae group sp. J254-4 TaxID=3079589 RepID=UPI0029066D78|nr:type II restriction endonuclease [Pseudomonas syringae group sp. J254-4]MDU8458041.1 type II restriction endonuclease [Pseudomonas syringae group sp. J254-4]